MISEDVKLSVDKIESPFDFPIEVIPKPTPEKPPKKRAAKVKVEGQGPGTKQLRLKLPLKPEPSLFSLPEQPTSANAYDLTDQVG